MTRSEIKLEWGAGVPAALWDPKHGLRSWPYDLDPAEGRPAGMRVNDEKWNNGTAPAYQSWSGLTGTVFAPRLFPLTLQLCTLRTDTVRWEVRHANCVTEEEADWPQDWHSARHIYAVHNRLQLTGDLLVAWPHDDRMVLTPANRLAEVLTNSIEPAEWMEVSQTAWAVPYRHAYLKERSVEMRCGSIEGSRGWRRHDFLKALRAIHAKFLSVGRINLGHDHIREFPGLGIVGVTRYPIGDTNNDMDIYRREGGMLVQQMETMLPVDWQPRAWQDEWDLWPDVLFSEDGRWVAPGPDGKLVFGPCGCSSRDFREWSDTDPFTDLLIDPHRVPEHPTCVSDNWHGHSSRPARNRTPEETPAEAPAEAPAEPLKEWEVELLAASGHADMI